jgi:primary-amine oxidase
MNRLRGPHRVRRPTLVWLLLVWAITISPLACVAPTTQSATTGARAAITPPSTQDRAARGAQPAHTQAVHPLDPLTSDEIATTTAVLRASGRVPVEALFHTIALREPPKTTVLAFRPGDPLPREAFVVLLDWRNNRTSEAVVDVTRRQLVSWRDVPGVQPGTTRTERALVPALVRADARWQDAMRRRGITDFTSVQLSSSAPGDPPVPLPTIPVGTRLIRSMSFYRQDVRDAAGQPIADTLAMVDGVVALVDLNRRAVAEVIDTRVVPLTHEGAALPVPPAVPSRPAPKPLQIVQPQGPSFEIRGHEIAWQNWRFRFALHPREGLVLYTVGYEDEGRVRPILYRAALSEMFVPYGDPDSTWVWHQPFDVGEFSGMATYAHPLTAGVQVPSNAVLAAAVLADDSGTPYVLPGAVAMYERDGGILWSHYDLGRQTSQTRRARQLVLSFIATVTNYDYGFHWVFNEDGTLEVQVELSGILTAKAVAAGRAQAEPARKANVDPYGVLVAPHVWAPTHQHFFNFRLDFDVEGTDNNVVEKNARGLPLGPQNPYGNAIVTEATLLTRELQARREASRAHARMWTVFNQSVRNSLGHPAGYALEPAESAVSYFAREAAPARRAGFVHYDLWVTRYAPDQMNAAGAYPNQGRGGEGLPAWTADDEPIADTDVVLWYTFGIHHHPRAEEWPVMLAVRGGFKLVPNGFFARNPTLGLPAPAGAPAGQPAR